MFRFSTLIIVVAAVAMLVTNPNLEAHKKVVDAKLEQDASQQGPFRPMALHMMEAAGLIKPHYNNYYLLSTVSVDDKLMSIGCFAHVWPWNLPKQAQQAPWSSNPSGS